jgi:hypothetical protein
VYLARQSFISGCELTRVSSTSTNGQSPQVGDNPVNGRAIDLAKQCKVCAVLANKICLHLNRSVKSKHINEHIRNTQTVLQNLPTYERNILQHSLSPVDY